MKPKFKTLLILLLIAVLGGAGLLYKSLSSENRGLRYHTVKVSRSDVKSTILATGVVTPENRLDLKAPVTGRIEKVLVREGQKVKKGQVLAWMSSTERAALIDTARSKGQAEIDYWESAYKMTPILAPGRGLIILKNVDAGQTVTQTDTILSQSDRLIVRANVDETDLAQVREGQRVELMLDAFPNNVLGARVEHIGYDAKTVNNVTTYNVDVLADETPAFMKSGMTANVTFLIAEKEDVVVVPAASVRRDKKKSFVLVPNPDGNGEPIQREIQVGITDGKKVEVVAGVAEGEIVMSAAMKGGKDGSKRDSSPFGSPMGGVRPR